MPSLPWRQPTDRVGRDPFWDAGRVIEKAGWVLVRDHTLLVSRNHGRRLCYSAEFTGELAPRYEIAELAWIGYSDCWRVTDGERQGWGLCATRRQALPTPQDEMVWTWPGTR
jgi:hypothetical protein